MQSSSELGTFQVSLQQYNLTRSKVGKEVQMIPLVFLENKLFANEDTADDELDPIWFLRAARLRIGCVEYALPLAAPPPAVCCPLWGWGPPDTEEFPVSVLAPAVAAAKAAAAVCKLDLRVDFLDDVTTTP